MAEPIDHMANYTIDYTAVGGGRWQVPLYDPLDHPAGKLHVGLGGASFGHPVLLKPADAGWYSEWAYAERVTLADLTETCVLHEADHPEYVGDEPVSWYLEVVGSGHTTGHTSANKMHYAYFNGSIWSTGPGPYYGYAQWWWDTVPHYYPESSPPRRWVDLRVDMNVDEWMIRSNAQAGARRFYGPARADGPAGTYTRWGGGAGEFEITKATVWDYRSAAY